MRNTPFSFFILSLAIAMVSAADRGLAWPYDGKPEDFGLFSNPPITWLYNWESWVPDGKPDNMEYVAMQRTRDNLDQLQGNMQNNGAKILLGFNEPDHPDQAAMGVDEAIQLWNSNIKQFADSDIRLGSPAITNGPSGLPWLQDFMNRCTDCKVDFLCIHWYGTDFGSFQKQVEDVHNAFPDKKIWVTEFSLNLEIPADQQKGFMDQAIPYLESKDFVERYAWFGALRDPNREDPTPTGDGLINPNGGALTDLGNDYNTPSSAASSGLATGTSTNTKKSRKCLRLR